MVSMHMANFVGSSKALAGIRLAPFSPAQPCFACFFFLPSPFLPGFFLAQTFFFLQARRPKPSPPTSLREQKATNDC
jgi:hypothetical protein